MSNRRCFNPRRIGALGGDGVNRAAARSNAMHLGLPTPSLIYETIGQSGVGDGGQGWEWAQTAFQHTERDDGHSPSGAP